MSKTQQKPVSERVEEAFPAPGFRENQKEVIETIVGGFEEKGVDVVELSAPTGFGKSITLYSVLEAMGARGFYLTPLKSLQEQLVDDDFIGDRVIEIMGRSNYDCILPDSDTTVDKGKCNRDQSFECDYKDSCPYYIQKKRAIEHNKTVMNLSYLMAEGFVPDHADLKFGDREVIIIDECQSLESWALNFVGLTISKNSVPEMVWNNITLPDESKMDDMQYLQDWLLDDVISVVEDVMAYYQSQSLKSEDEQEELEKLSRFDDKIRRFLADVVDNHWVAQKQTEIRKNKPNYSKVVFKPIKVGRFLEDLVWSRADKIILSSATIPKGNWRQEIGLGDRKAMRIDVPSEFPTDNRPIVTNEAVGKMTKAKREENMPDAVEKVKAMSEFHDGEKGIVHCRGYNYIDMFKRAAVNNGHRKWFNENIHIQDRMNREESLEEWTENDKQIFMSVNMAEGIDLAGDLCRWQILLKTNYPFMGDKRVNYRINKMDDWDWYNRHAAIQIQQAYGRAVRSKDDEAVFYILDSSAVGLIQRNTELFEDWFLDGVTDLHLDY